MIFKVGGQRSTERTVDRGGDCVSPGSKGGWTRGNREGGVTRGS